MYLDVSFLVLNHLPYVKTSTDILIDGMGPLLWSPMSELPMFGRNIPYVITFALFIILSIPTALVDNFGGFLFLRFLLGFFGSPCLATGGASMGDLVS